ncbi:MAG: Gfo/Idh/MocA family oxidoreductase [Clostridiales bacterium]|jgi:hypothetical protein|nr:Gfo/Idh/MocA family oxidoreductase [Clostridiales bacterium]
MKIGLIGAQNSHSRHFCEVFNKDMRHAGHSIAYLYGGDDPGEAAKLCEGYGVIACGSEDEAIERSDAIAITYRNGADHHAPAMKALRAGKPLFNDKPFAASAREAREIVDYAGGRGLLLTGGSSIKSLPGIAPIAATVGPGSTVVVSFAADIDSEYGGYRFYGAHSAETALALCGEGFLSVSAMRNSGAVISTVHYADRQCIIVTAPQLGDLAVSVTNGRRTERYNVEKSYQSICPDEFAKMLDSGEVPRGYGFYLRAAELLDGIVESAGL